MVAKGIPAVSESIATKEQDPPNNKHGQNPAHFFLFQRLSGLAPDDQSQAAPANRFLVYRDYDFVWVI